MFLSLLRGTDADDATLIQGATSTNIQWVVCLSESVVQIKICFLS